MSQAWYSCYERYNLWFPVHFRNALCMLYLRTADLPQEDSLVPATSGENVSAIMRACQMWDSWRVTYQCWRLVWVSVKRQDLNPNLHTDENSPWLLKTLQNYHRTNHLNLSKAVIITQSFPTYLILRYISHITWIRIPVLSRWQDQYLFYRRTIYGPKHCFSVEGIKKHKLLIFI